MSVRIFPFHHHEEACQRDSVFLHGCGEVGNHCRILDALQFCDACASEYDRASDMVIYAACGFFRIYQKTRLFRKSGYIFLYVVIWKGADMIFVKMSLYFIGQFFFIDEEYSVVLVKIQESDIDRGEAYVAGGT